MVRLLLIPAAAMALIGCSSTQAPALKVTDAKVVNRTADGVVIEFLLEAENPNGDALPLKDVNYTVTLDDKEVFSGSRFAEATLSRYGRQFITFPAAISLSPEQLVAPTSSYVINGSLVYEVPGAIARTLFDQEVFEPTVSFSGTGTIAIPPAPADGGNGPRVTPK